MLALLQKDLLLELRTREMTTSFLLLGVLVLLICSFAFDPTTPMGQAAAPGVLWVSVTFAGVLGINRSLLRETENGCLQALLLAPVDRGTLFLAKATGNFLILAVSQLIVLPVFVIFFNLPFLEVFVSLVPILLLGTLGFSGLGTLFAAVSLRTRAREVMLPLLLLPLTTPLFLACVEASRVALGVADGSDLKWLRLLFAFDVISLVVGWIAFEFVVED